MTEKEGSVFQNPDRPWKLSYEIDVHTRGMQSVWASKISFYAHYLHKCVKHCQFLLQSGMDSTEGEDSHILTDSETIGQ